MKVLEALYQVEQTRDAWFAGVLRTVVETLGRGAGVGGVLYDLSSGPALHIDAMDSIDVPSDWVRAGEAMHRDPRLVPGIRTSYRSCLCASLTDLTAIEPQGMRAARRDYYAPRNVGGQTMINGLDGSGKGCSLFIFSREEASLSPNMREVLSCLATHLATAYRLQRRLMPGEATPAGEIEAVLAPNGEIAHAEPSATAAPARQALRLAVREREGARRFMPPDAAGMLKAWKGLVSARWTLVDEDEQGGRRYVLARENSPAGRGPAALSARERQVVSLAVLGRSNKLISYELGLAHSTVRVLVARACAKLAVSSRAELVSRLQAPV
jgi:DNA-binding CsgD family transcriptional regulator